MRAFSEGMTRIRHEIGILRQKRKQLLFVVRRGSMDRRVVVSQMLAAFLTESIEVTRRRRAGRNRSWLISGGRSTPSGRRPRRSSVPYGKPEPG